MSNKIQILESKPSVNDFTIFTRLCISIGFLKKQSTSSKFGNNFLKSFSDSSYAVIKQTLTHPYL
jgi:hypothetical protein